MASGSATVSLISDGGTGEGSIDGLGQVALAPAVVPVNVTVDAYAAAAITSSGPALVATGPGAYALNLGTVAKGQALAPVTLSVGNTATGPADVLSGAFAVSGSSAFGNTGFGSFSNVAGGGAVSAGTITEDTSQSGTYTETLTITSRWTATRRGSAWRRRARR